MVRSLSMENYPPELAPMKQNYIKQIQTSELLPADNRYREIIGKILYISTFTRPDISSATGLLCRKSDKPTNKDWNALMSLVRYLNHTASLKLKLPANDSPSLILYVDADHAGDLTDRKSTSGNIVFFGGGAISWASKKQTVTATSTSEAEYVSAALGCGEIQWLVKLFKDMGLEIPMPVTVYEDNETCIRMAEAEGVSNSSRHIDLKYHIVKNLYKDGIVKLIYCPTRDMIADALTKPLPREQFEILRAKMGLVA